jgi:prepilin signal peptidase PulO-like enzyme (type II secretory pathway)
MMAVMAAFITLGSFLGLHTIGAGDVKLAGAMGLTLGFPRVIYGLLGMSAIIVVWCLGGLLTKKITLKSMVAFAPFITAGTILAILAKVIGL